MAHVPLSPVAHRDFVWLKNSDWHFARENAVMPVSAMEMPKLCTEFVSGWIESNDHLQLVVLMGLRPDFNLFVANDGSWLPGCMPVTLQCTPFTIGLTEHRDPVLCFDDQAGSLSQASDSDREHAYPLFNAEGALCKEADSITQTLLLHQQNLHNTRIASDALQEEGLIKPWAANINTELSGTVNLEGLFYLDEGALNRCSPEVLKSLQNKGALAMAYCQLISQQHLERLGRLADAHMRLEQRKSDNECSKELDLGGFFAGEENDAFKF